MKGKNGKITDSTRLILRYLGQALGFQTLPIFNDEFIQQAKEIPENSISNCAEWSTIRWKTLAQNLKNWQDIVDNKKPLVHRREKRKAVSIGNIDSKEYIPVEKSKNLLWNNKDLTADRNQKSIQKITCNAEYENNIPEKDKGSKRIKKLHRFNGHQRAIEDITSVGDLLSSDYVDMVIDLYHNDCGTSIYIAGAYTTSLIRLEEDSNNWKALCRLFRNIRALNKNDGVYIIPTFTGDINSGH